MNSSVEFAADTANTEAEDDWLFADVTESFDADAGADRASSCDPMNLPNDNEHTRRKLNSRSNTGTHVETSSMDRTQERYHRRGLCMSSLCGWFDHYSLCLEISWYLE